MISEEKIRDEKTQYKIKRESSEKYQPQHQANLIKMNVLEVKKYYLLIKVKQYN